MLYTRMGSGTPLPKSIAVWGMTPVASSTVASGAVASSPRPPPSPPATSLTLPTCYTPSPPPPRPLAELRTSVQLGSPLRPGSPQQPGSLTQPMAASQSDHSMCCALPLILPRVRSKASSGSLNSPVPSLTHSNSLLSPGHPGLRTLGSPSGPLATQRSNSSSGGSPLAGTARPGVYRFGACKSHAHHAITLEYFQRFQRVIGSKQRGATGNQSGRMFCLI